MREHNRPTRHVFPLSKGEPPIIPHRLDSIYPPESIARPLILSVKQNQKAFDLGSEYETIQRRRQPADANLEAIRGPSSQNRRVAFEDSSSDRPQLEASERSGIVIDHGLSLLEANRDVLESPSDVQSASDLLGIVGASYEQDLLPLGEQVRRAMCRSYNRDAVDKWFLPIDALDRIIHPLSVRRYLDEQLGLRSSASLSVTQIQDLVDYICGNPAAGKIVEGGAARRIFAILALNERPAADIANFRNDGVYDKDLPLAKDQPDSSRNIFHLKRHDDHGDSPQLNSCFRNWTQGGIERFESRQWQIHVPYFAQSPKKAKTLLYEFDDRTVLPWTSWSPPISSRFSEVRKISIHHAHHDFGSSVSQSAHSNVHLRRR